MAVDDDSIVAIGFLSPHAQPYADDIRKANADWFGIAERVNRFGQKLMATVELKNATASDPKLLALLLLIRTMSNFQGVILLAGRGMIVEARTLARCCYENMYCLAALKKHGDAFVTKMRDDELASKKATANWLLQKKGRLDYAGDDAEERLRKTIAEANSIIQGGRHVFDQIAESADVGDLYLFYRQLSWDAAHPSVTALNRYLDADADNTVRTLRWGPDCPTHEAGEVLNICLPAVFVTMISWHEVLTGKPDQPPELAVLWQDYRKLLRV